MPTKRGINLGCGTVILPCERPAHHGAIPAEIYTASDIEWDNVDRNPQPGVNKVINLFDYPWRENNPLYGKHTPAHLATELPSNTYDVAIAAHIVEHIPHHIVWNGQIVPFHEDYQDGWFAWFAELWRIMKPGGKAYILVPYAWSNAGISDPTHTRYLTFASFNYFSNADDDNPAFRYKMNGARWRLSFEDVVWQPHEQARAIVDRKLAALTDTETLDARVELWRLSMSNINMMVEFMVPMTAVK